MTLLAALLLLGHSVAVAAVPHEVTAYVQERELCDHFRGEPFEGQEPEQIERREFLQQSVEIYCAGTDRRLAALKLRYKDHAAALSLLEQYEPSSEGRCEEALDVPAQPAR